jgi:gluconokinase
MGVSGSGKSTVGTALAQRLGWAFVDGDHLHPAANVERMAAGTPLTDADRAPWLDAVADVITQHLAAREPVVVACSALKRAYRDRLQRAGDVRLAYLAGTREVLAARLSARHGHFMPPSLLDSQLRDLEPPAPDEHVVTVDIEAGVAEQAEQIIDLLGLLPPQPQA